MLYVLLGIHSGDGRATLARARMVRHSSTAQVPASEPGTHFVPLARLMGRVIGRPLLAGNAIEPLVAGAQAFPAMLEAIRGARTSIAMASYIFDGTGIGADFVDALGDAARRGVDVRVLIDDVDARWSSSTAVKPL